MSKLQIGAFFAGILAIIAYLGVFIVDEREQAVKFRLGEIVQTEFPPGLYFQIPFLNNVKKFDKRILTVDLKPERFLTSEKKYVIVDAFVKWRIADVSNYYTTTQGDERRAVSLMAEIIIKALKDQFGRRTINQVVSGERGELMDIVTENVGKNAEKLGIAIVDVRVKGIDLPDDVSRSVYQRMVKERATVAKEFRSQGQELAKGIRADAERQREELLAEAYKEAEQIRGAGDALSTEIYAKAFGKNPEFYSFYRSLNAYKQSFSQKSDVVVLQPDSDFFKYFNNSKGK